MNNGKKEEPIIDKTKISQSDKFLEELNNKMKEILKETKEIKPDAEAFKNNSLPLARIKKIMKSDECVKMIAGEAPILFSKACELFIIELAYRSWIHTVESNRRTLQRSDIATAIAQTDFFDFLLDIVDESCKKKLQMYANYQIPTTFDQTGINNLMYPGDGKFGTSNMLYPPTNPEYMLMNNLNPNYPQNMMYHPNPNMNNLQVPYMNTGNSNSGSGKDDEKKQADIHNNINTNPFYSSYPGNSSYNNSYQSKFFPNQK